MRVSGFSFIRNGVTFDYPFLESISSLLPLVDEFVIVVGDSDDDTLERIQSLRSPKIKIIETVWDPTLRTSGMILAQQTNIALSHVTGDWAFYLQADEVLHERDYEKIRNAMETYLHDDRVEGLLFSFLHFYGSYEYVGAARRWYRREVRIIRNGIGAQSWGDAQGFRIGNRKLNVKLADATIYHYGWVRPPHTQMLKQRFFHKLWHDDTWVERILGTETEYDYSAGGKLERFHGTHPSVMQRRVQSQNWDFRYNPARLQQPWLERISDWFEAKTGIRLGEYRNYRLL
jgi:glycosyltransferase involved in cell wall biosynthesis